MELLTRLEADLKQAMKERDELRVSCLRLACNALKLKSKDLMRSLSEEEQIQALKTLAKQRREAWEMFLGAQRHDLADKEKRELAIIESYLPAQLDEAALNSLLDEVFSALEPQGPKDTGKIMKEVMARLAGAADGRLVSQLVRRRFES